ncbi:hypothetical protein lbkm_0261 [Lachnospiraceae bacterium KM106-2]|nr:hypothetical protein lbkm_0261 [Lachnospiraceae bacterium KM106-2]
MAYMNIDYLSINMTGMLGDYGIIRSGSYGKLLKKYYAENKNDAASGSSSTTQSKLMSVKSEADDLKASAESLTVQGSKSLFAEGNRDKIATAVNKFVSDYNDTVKGASETKNKDISRYVSSMTFQTNAYKTSLEKVGIKVNGDQTLTVDTTKLKEAKLSDLKTLFSGSYSYADSVANKAEQISKLATKASGFPTYQSNGMFGTTSQYQSYNWYL